MIIKGNVKAINGEPLMGVNIFPVKDGKPFEVGGVTDYDGNFSIDLKELPDSQPVKFSFVGFNPVVYTAKELTNKNVVLVDNFEMLDEVIVTAPKPTEPDNKNKIAQIAQIALIVALIGGTATVGYVLMKQRT